MNKKVKKYLKEWDKNKKKFILNINKNKLKNKKYYGGADQTEIVSIQNKNKEIAENTTTNIQRADIADNAIMVFAAAEIAVQMATPLLAASGVGIPLAVTLYALHKLAVQFKEDVILSEMISDCNNIISNCFFLNNLITRTLLLFKSIITKTEKEIDEKYKALMTTLKISSNVTNVTSVTKIRIDPKILLRIDDKLKEFNELLIKISPDNQELKNAEKGIRSANDTTANKGNTTGFFSKISKIGNSVKSGLSRANRFFSARTHRDDIIKQLSIINSLFIIYNSQFDWIIASYVRSLEMIDDKNIVPKIWIIIENSKEFQEYLYPPTEDKIAEFVEEQVTEEHAEKIVIEEQKELNENVEKDKIVDDETKVEDEKKVEEIKLNESAKNENDNTPNQATANKPITNANVANVFNRVPNTSSQQVSGTSSPPEKKSFFGFGFGGKTTKYKNKNKSKYKKKTIKNKFSKY